jgi:histidinol dehydrogenase
VLVERLNAEDVHGRSSGPPGASGPALVAERLRRAVRSGSSEEIWETVEQIVAEVCREGDEAVDRHTRELDTDGARPSPLVVGADERDEAVRRLPLEVVAGLQVAIANVAQVAQAGVGGDLTVELPQGQRIRLRELPVSSAAV